ncbi:MAG: hypothetical protein VKP62_03315 [Candidatus Sericytochromatia bacterium]|nr:hypothetical protein [Candidatus Sericytochromatia bacterium]
MTPKLQAARAECERHAQVLTAALEALSALPEPDEDEHAGERLRRVGRICATP